MAAPRGAVPQDIHASGYSATARAERIPPTWGWDGYPLSSTATTTRSVAP